MKLGIFLDLRNPSWCERPWAAHYARSIDLAVDAEGAGLDSVWLSEHHLFADGYLPQPLVFAAAVAARTRRVRIGTGVLLAALRHPLHIAEEAAIVDLVSGGRLELGFGAGYRIPEFAAAGADFRGRFAATDEAVVAVRSLLANTVTPPPVQRPIPIWLGYASANGARRAGALGVNLLSVDRTLLEPYLEGLAAGGHGAATARMGGVIDLVVSDDPERDTVRLRPHLAHQRNTYLQSRFEGTGQAAPPPITVEELAALHDAGQPTPGTQVVTPDGAIALIRRITDGLPVEHVYCWASIAGMPDDMVDRHIELLATAVRPSLGAETIEG
jgi:alkanesulfonate monooxygenase SsuD/methylene tetrahydromethanopterin reductase-like flavin-dependent oxidoreductase (luciferase family)